MTNLNRKILQNVGAVQDFGGLKRVLMEIVKVLNASRATDSVIADNVADLEEVVGDIDMVAQDYALEVAAGRISGTSGLHKYGSNGAVGTVYTVIGSSLGTTYPFPTTLETIKIVSGSASDTVAGVGMRSMRIYGIIAGWKLGYEDVELSGITPVTTTQEFYRVFRAHGIDSGAYGANNVGAITITNSISAQVLLVIPATIGQSLIAVYTVPAGKTGYMTGGFISSDSTKTLDFQLVARFNADRLVAPFGTLRVMDTIVGITRPLSWYYKSYRVFEGPCDIWMQAKVSVSTSDVSALFEMYLEDN